MVSNDQRIRLYPCCKIVEGANKDAIYDLQREEYFLIPHSLTLILKECENYTWQQIVQKYSSEQDTLEEYKSFLQKNDLCYSITSADVDIKDIDITYETPELISNAIIDIDEDTTYDIRKTILQLDELGCENLEIRFFGKFELQKLNNVVDIVGGTIVRDLELLFEYSKEISMEYLINLHLLQTRIRKISIYNSPKDRIGIYNHDELTLIFIGDNIFDSSSCGITNQWYLLPKTELYLESLQYNTCLYKKIAVDKCGYIRNCPSMKKSYGNIDTTSLIEVVKNSDFKEMWYVKKDDIEICKDCELRYMCQDCRAYINDENNIFSKPLKCSYNPYI